MPKSFSHPAAKLSFRVEPDAQQPVPGRPSQRRGGRDPLVVEFEIGFELAHLQRLAKFSPEDRLDADRIARFSEDDNGFDRQEFTDPGNFLCQPYFVGGTEHNHVARKFGACESRLDDLPAQRDLGAIAVVTRNDQIGLVLGSVHGLLPPVQSLLQAKARSLREFIYTQRAIRHRDNYDGNLPDLLLPDDSERAMSHGS